MRLYSVLFCGIVACDESSKDGNTSLEDTGVSDGQEDAPPPPFRPAEGHWTYDGGELIVENTTCSAEGAGGEPLDPVGFTLSLRDDGFQLLSDGEADALPCTLADPDLIDPGGFFCEDTTAEESIEEDDFEVTLQIITRSEGFFDSDGSMKTTFTLDFTCVEASHPFFDVTCAQVEQEAGLPCTLQFNANAALDTTSGG